MCTYCAIQGHWCAVFKNACCQLHNKITAYSNSEFISKHRIFDYQEHLYIVKKYFFGIIRITRGRPAVEIRPLFIKFLSLNIIEVFF
jgi:hypothetical protein